MKPIKVHDGLERVDRENNYHLGYYEIDFADECLSFQLHSRICGNPECFCDTLKIDWVTETNTFETWYSSQRVWRDNEHKELHPEVAGVFRIIEKSEGFQERYLRLMYLRRRAVLEELNRLEPPFCIRVPPELVMPGGFPERGTLGRITLKSGKKSIATAFEVHFCDDPQCYCENLFLTLPDYPESPHFAIEPPDQWSVPDGDPGHRRLMKRVRQKLGGFERFPKLLDHLRMERRFQNYFRFVLRYREQHPSV